MTTETKIAAAAAPTVWLLSIVCLCVSSAAGAGLTREVAVKASTATVILDDGDLTTLVDFEFVGWDSPGKITADNAHKFVSWKTKAQMAKLEALGSKKLLSKAEAAEWFSIELALRRMSVDEFFLFNDLDMSVTSQSQYIEIKAPAPGKTASGSLKLCYSKEDYEQFRNYIVDQRTLAKTHIDGSKLHALDNIRAKHRKDFKSRDDRIKRLEQTAQRIKKLLGQSFNGYDPGILERQQKKLKAKLDILRRGRNDAAARLKEIETLRTKYANELARKFAASAPGMTPATKLAAPAKLPEPTTLSATVYRVKPAAGGDVGGYWIHPSRGVVHIIRKGKRLVAKHSFYKRTFTGTVDNYGIHLRYEFKDLNDLATVIWGEDKRRPPREVIQQVPHAVRFIAFDFQMTGNDLLEGKFTGLSIEWNPNSKRLDFARTYSAPAKWTRKPSTGAATKPKTTPTDDTETDTETETETERLEGQEFALKFARKILTDLLAKKQKFEAWKKRHTDKPDADDLQRAKKHEARVKELNKTIASGAKTLNAYRKDRAEAMKRSDVAAAGKLDVHIYRIQMMLIHLQGMADKREQEARSLRAYGTPNAPEQPDAELLKIWQNAVRQGEAAVRETKKRISDREPEGPTFVPPKIRPIKIPPLELKP